MKFDKLEWQRNRRANNDNSWTRKYEKTKKGFLVRMYRNMKSRTCGIQKKKSHLYLGLTLLEKDLFYDWALSSEQFHAMFSAWELSNYHRKLTPTVDRIDSEFGYIVENMQWLTHSDNSRKGVNSKNAKL
jgi:hypothetical protein